MLGGIFEKNNIKDKIQTFDKKITESNFWKDKFSSKIFPIILILLKMNWKI